LDVRSRVAAVSRRPSPSMPATPTGSPARTSTPRVRAVLLHHPAGAGGVPSQGQRRLGPLRAGGRVSVRMIEALDSRRTSQSDGPLRARCSIVSLRTRMERAIRLGSSGFACSGAMLCAPADCSPGPTRAPRRPQRTDKVSRRLQTAVFQRAAGRGPKRLAAVSQ
jgi:hypothetical protein